MKKKKRNIFLTIIQIVLVGVMLYSGYNIFTYYYENWKNTQLINESKSSVAQIEKEYASNGDIKALGKLDKDEAAKKIIKELQKKNKDVVAFVRLQEAEIYYPVVYVKNDNSYYLWKNLDKEFSRPGTIFLNGFNKSNFTDMNSTLFGHHLQTKNAHLLAPMFKYLLRFSESDFVDPNKEYKIELFTEEGYKEYKVFSGYTTSEEDNYISPNYKKSEWVKFLEKRRKMSDIKMKFNHEFSENDKILTLSTCGEDVTAPIRYVIHGILVE